MAWSDLEIAREPHRPRVRREMLCFHAQQAAEKSVKAVLQSHGVVFPLTHNIRTLVDLLPPAAGLPPAADDAVELSDYAVMSRYPGEGEPISQQECDRAVALAEGVVAWAEAMLGSGPE